MDKAAPDPLQVVRGRIDAIDEEMHRLLIERAGVIAELIRIKGTSKPGAAFRPDREADMMRRIVMRHEGDLPLATVEHIWREIISTFTAMQAPFTVVAGLAADPLAMRDVVRFYFGFSVPVETAETSQAAVERIAESRQAVAVVPAEGRERWWGGLVGAEAPKVFAKLPFMELPVRPADLPAYVVGPPLKEPLDPDIRLLALKHLPRLEDAVLSYGGRISGRAGGELLVELPVAASLEDIARGASGAVVAEDLGGFCQPIRFVAERVA